jgi:hypothetical protein
MTAAGLARTNGPAIAAGASGLGDCPACGRAITDANREPFYLLGVVRNFCSNRCAIFHNPR